MSEKIEIILKEKNVIGKRYFYPSNEASKVLLSMSKCATGRRKAFTVEDVEKIKILGFEIKILVPRVVYE